MTSWSPVLSAKVALAVIFMIVAGWLSVAVTLGSYYRNAAPEKALAFSPWDARARAVLADRAITRQGDKPDVAGAKKLALEALRRDVTVTGAWRSLGLAEDVDGHRALAARLVGHAERLSRRDLPTQLWLIESDVAKGDVRGALGHYDVALRVHPEAQAALFPVLIAASEDRSIADELGRRLASNPPWAADLYYQLGQVLPKGEAIPNILEAARRSGPLPPYETIPYLLQPLADRGDFDGAFRTYAAITGQPYRRDKPLANADFEHASQYPPFDWQLISEGNAGADITSVSGRDGSALVAYSGGDDKVVARQLFALLPGRYRLTLSGGRTDVAPAAVTLRITCASDGVLLLAHEVVESQAPQGGEFAVAQGCRAQWIVAEVRSTAPGRNEYWIDDLRITRAPS